MQVDGDNLPQAEGTVEENKNESQPPANAAQEEQEQEPIDNRIAAIMVSLNVSRAQIEGAGIDVSILSFLPEEEVVSILSGLEVNENISGILENQEQNSQPPAPQENEPVAEEQVQAIPTEENVVGGVQPENNVQAVAEEQPNVQQQEIEEPQVVRSNEQQIPRIKFLILINQLMNPIVNLSQPLTLICQMISCCKASSAIWECLSQTLMELIIQTLLIQLMLQIQLMFLTL